MKNITGKLILLVVVLLTAFAGCEDVFVDLSEIENKSGETATFTDPRDGQSYNTVVIGSQTWMSENINYITETSWCYDDESTNCDSSYGRLYTFYDALLACPPGWHNPSDDEWKVLEGMVDTKYGVGNSEWYSQNVRGKDAGKRLKATTSWLINSGTDAFGFKAMAAGVKNHEGLFNGISYSGIWWTGSLYGSESATCRVIQHDEDGIGRYNTYLDQGYSVRCLKDAGEAALIAYFLADTMIGEPPLRVTFTDLSSGSPTSWNWDFGDGETSTEQNPEHIYQETGTYSVEFTVSNGDGSDTEMKVDYIFVTAVSPEGESCPGLETIEYGGQVYNTVLVGDQCWLKENLNIGQMVPGDDDMRDNGNIEKYCFDDDPANCDTYGGLYQWDEMMQYENNEGAQGLCPNGWHIPTDEEWKILEGTVDSQYPVGDPEWDDQGWRGFDASLNLKSITAWDDNGNGIDLYGFSALPGGYSSYEFFHKGTMGYWWSSSEFSADNAKCRKIINITGYSGRSFFGKDLGYSVRCLRD